MLTGVATGKTKTLTAAVAHRIGALGVPELRLLAVISSAPGGAISPFWRYATDCRRQNHLRPEGYGMGLGIGRKAPKG